MVWEIEHCVKFLEAANGMVGEEGPFYFAPQVNDPPPNDKFAIGEKGRAVTLEDVLATFKAVGANRNLGREQSRLFFEGFRWSEDGKTLYMLWGS